MNSCRYSVDGSDGVIKFKIYKLFNIRMTVAIAENNWYEEDKKRLIPFWIDDDGLFAWRFAMNIRKIKQNID